MPSTTKTIKTLHSDEYLTCNLCGRKQKNWLVWIPEMTIEDRLCNKHALEEIAETERQAELLREVERTDEVIINIQRRSVLSRGNYEGFLIRTNYQDIEIGITRERSCCELHGYFDSEPPAFYIGAHFRGIELTDTELITHFHTQGHREASRMNEYGGVMFVNIKTDRGVYQVAVYNWHNGYYGHDVYVHSQQLTTERHM